MDASVVATVNFCRYDLATDPDHAVPTWPKPSSGCGLRVSDVSSALSVWLDRRRPSVCLFAQLCFLCDPSELKAQQEPMLTCELCGRVDFAYIFKRSKRFCSTVCAKR